MDNGSLPESITEQVLRIANNALFFDDNSDYGSALWKILSIVDPEFDEDAILEYIEEA